MIQIFSGNYVGNGVIDTLIAVGADLTAQNSFVIVKRSNAATIGALRWTGMQANGSFSFGSGGYDFNGIRNFAGTGFNVGNGINVNGPGDAYEWVAIIGTAGEIDTGTYTGNGADNRTIALSLGGGTPAWVIVKKEGTPPAQQRMGSNVGDQSGQMNGVAFTADRIQAFGVDSFEIGSNTEVNGNLDVFVFIAFKSIVGTFEAGSYVGDGLDNRDIVAGFLPEFVLLLGTNAMPARFRTSNMVGDTGSLGVSGTNSGFAANRIQALQATGFQIGTDADVNVLASTYFFVAAMDSAAPPAGIAGSRMLMGVGN